MPNPWQAMQESNRGRRKKSGRHNALTFPDRRVSKLNEFDKRTLSISQHNRSTLAARVNKCPCVDRLGWETNTAINLRFSGILSIAKGTGELIVVLLSQRHLGART